MPRIKQSKAKRGRLPAAPSVARPSPPNAVSAAPDPTAGPPPPDMPIAAPPQQPMALPPAEPGISAAPATPLDTMAAPTGSTGYQAGGGVSAPIFGSTAPVWEAPSGADTSDSTASALDPTRRALLALAARQGLQAGGKVDPFAGPVPGGTLAPGSRYPEGLPIDPMTGQVADRMFDPAGIYASPVGAPAVNERGTYQAGGPVPSIGGHPIDHHDTNRDNFNMILHHAKTDRPKGKRLLQGLRREHTALRSMAANALITGPQHDHHAVHMLNHAHAKVPDGHFVHISRQSPDQFTAQVHHKAATREYPLNRQQMIEHATGLSGGFDHSMDMGPHKLMRILKKPRRGMGYQKGGPVFTDPMSGAELPDSPHVVDPDQATVQGLNSELRRDHLSTFGNLLKYFQGADAASPEEMAQTRATGGLGRGSPTATPTGYQDPGWPAPTQEPVEVAVPGMGAGEREALRDTGLPKERKKEETTGRREPAETAGAPATAPAQDVQWGTAPTSQEAEAESGVSTARPSTTPLTAGEAAEEAGVLTPAQQRDAGYRAAYRKAAESGDVYTTPSWSWDRQTKEIIPDIMKGRLFGRPNVVPGFEQPTGAQAAPAAGPSKPMLGGIDTPVRTPVGTSAGPAPLGPTIEDYRQGKVQPDQLTPQQGSYPERPMEGSPTKLINGEPYFWGAGGGWQKSPPGTVDERGNVIIPRERQLERAADRLRLSAATLGPKEKARAVELERQAGALDAERYGIQTGKAGRGTTTDTYMSHLINERNKQQIRMDKWMEANGVNDPAKVPEFFRVDPELDRVVKDYHKGLPSRAGGQAPTGGGSTTGGAPRVGDVRQGYRFLGGNPADQRSWQKV